MMIIYSVITGGKETVMGFGFGIEAEFLLVTSENFTPLSADTLDAQQLLNIVDAIPTDDLSIEGFNTKPLHNKPGHYLIEGYCLTDEAMKPVKLLPKGIEVRTPLSSSIERSTAMLNDLHQRLNKALGKHGMTSAIVSHHPTQSKFEAPPNYTRYDYWQWALTATTTYGPDINISVPQHLAARIDRKRLHDKINYYMPSVVALSLASPFVDGDLFSIRGQIGKSIRTYRRSLWAPMYYIHEKPALRFEFKGFEMARSLSDYQAFFLLSLAILLDDQLEGTASDETRIYDLGKIAVSGLEPSWVKQRAQQVIKSAERIAHSHDFRTTGLQEMSKRLETGRLPADDLIQMFHASNGSIPAVLRQLNTFEQPFVAPANHPAFALSFAR